MRNFESIVRPFQTPTILAKKRLVATTDKLDINPAVLSWGKPGNISFAHEIDEIPTDVLDFTIETCKEISTEQARKVDQVRVEQTLPDGTKNPKNFVDLDRAYQVTMTQTQPTDASNRTQTWALSWEKENFRTFGDADKKCTNTYNFSR